MVNNRLYTPSLDSKNTTDQHFEVTELCLYFCFVVATYLVFQGFGA